MTVADLAQKLEAKPAGEGRWKARCPAHEDSRASLSIGTGEGGRVLLKCHAGCATKAMVTALGLTMGDLMPERPDAPPSRRKGGLGRIVATYAYRDESSELLFEVCRFEPKDFRQRHKAKPGEKADREGWCWSMREVRRVLYRLPELLAAVNAGGLIWLTEGEKDADALARLGLVATCNVGGAGKWRRDYTASLRGATRAIVIADKDAPGRAHAAAVAASLAGAGVEVRVVEVPTGKDASDWIASTATREDFERLAAQAPPWTPVAPAFSLGVPESGAANRPDIEIGPEEAEIVDQAEKLIGAVPALFQRAGLLVHARRDLTPPEFLRRPAGAPQIAPLSTPTCREALSRVARWWGYDARSGAQVRKRPPGWVAEDLLARGEWAHLRPLTAVIETPVLRPDGTVISTPGYDAATGLLYEPSGMVAEAPERPGRAHALAAKDALLEVVEDFPFVSEAHRAAWLASLLVWFARFAVRGHVPLTLFEAPAAGTGKTLLADTIGMICTGRELAKMANTLDDAEMRKRLLAIALAGDSFVLLDNVRGGFGTPSLDMALTAGVIRDRVLGLSEEKTVPLDAIFFASGNNVELLGDTRRRVLHCRVDAGEERPEERQGFRHSPLLPWVASERSRLTSAALTILRAYHLAGRPVVGKVKPWGSFEPWQDLVCGAVRWLGLAAPEDTRAGLAEAESEPERLATLLRAWRVAQPNEGMTAAEAMRRATAETNLADAIASVARRKDGSQATTESLGYYLRSVRGRMIGGLCFSRGTSGGDRRWFVASRSTDGGDGGDPQSTREKMACDSFRNTGQGSPPSPPSAGVPAHVCGCGTRFACPPTPGAGCLCPSCGLPPVHGRALDLPLTGSAVGGVA
ncbi:MAG: toprim domain-containing protein [Myxococcales bacterium]